MSREYHKVMSEIYFTRGIVWFMYTSVYFALQPPLFELFTAVNAFITISYFVKSFSEYRSYEEQGVDVL